jgi:peptidyl-prolyl cis-trans isomerase SurA
LIAVAGTTLAQTEQRIVVLVNDDPISAYDIEQRERFLAVTAREESSPALKKKATDMLIDERLKMQQGKTLGITADPADVTRVLENMAKKNKMDSAGLTSALAQMGVNIKTLKDRIKTQIVWRDVVRRKFRNDVLIGDAEVDEALAGSEPNEEGESAPKSAALQLRLVKFTLASGSDEVVAKRLAEAEALRARFNSCANVIELTKGISGASVKSLQDQSISALAQPARTLVMHAKVGQMTPPVISASAVELYAVCGKRAAQDDPKRTAAKNKLMQQELALRSERLLRDLRQDAFIEYR